MCVSASMWIWTCLCVYLCLCVAVFIHVFARVCQVLRRRDTILGLGRYGKGADMWSLGTGCWCYVNAVFTAMYKCCTEHSVTAVLPRCCRVDDNVWRLVLHDWSLYFCMDGS